MTRVREDSLSAGASPVTKTLADFIADPSVQIPAEVSLKTKLHILDTLGCQIAFAPLPWSRAVLEYANANGQSGAATIAHYGLRVPAELAAFANASFAHGFEMDDTEMRTASHPGVVVVPAALASGQVHRASGKDFLRAVTAGYEVMIRVGLGSVGMMRRGFHTTAVAGPFGSAAAAAVIAGLDPETTAHGLGIAASRAGGITEYSTSGGSVKRVHAGFAAQAGLESIALARAGITAPTAALEGRRGLFAAVSDISDSSLVTSGLGQRFELMTTGIKPYCCCAGQHAVIDAVAQIQAERPPFAPSSVKRIRVLQNAREVDVVGRIVEPTDITGAQFSAAFGIALRLVAGGNGFGDYLSANLDDDRLLSVARAVVYERTSADAPMAGDAPAEVTIEFMDGSVATARVHFARGTVQRPLGEAEVISKFHDLADGPLSKERADNVHAMVMNLEELEDVNALAAQLEARSNFDPQEIPASTVKSPRQEAH